MGTGKVLARSVAMFGMWAAALTPAWAQDPGKIRAAMGISDFSIQELRAPNDWTSFDVALDLGGRIYRVSFTPHSVRAPSYQLLAQDDSGALRAVPPPPETTYQGSVIDVPGAVVAGSVVDGRLTAMVRLSTEPGQTWNIQPLSDVAPGAPATAHIINRDTDVIPGPWTCGVPDGILAAAQARQDTGNGGTTGPGRAFLNCLIACDADNEFYVLNASSVPNTNNDIASVVNGMAAIYQSDANVTFQLGTVIVRQSATQPYTNADASTLLDQFRTEWTSNQAAIPRDVAHLFTGKDLVGSTIGLAYVGVICNSAFGFGESQSRFSANYANRVGVTSHEVGHNFSAGHCDSTCSPCRIMCSGIGGCSGVVTSFGCSAPTISSYASSAVCLSQLNNGIALPLADTFAASTLDYNRWPAPANAGAVVNTNAVAERSAPYSLDIANTSNITCAGIDMTSLGGRRVFVSFWSQHRGVEQNKSLVVQYRRPIQSDFLPLVTLVSDGVDQNTFAFSEVVLPLDGQGANASIKFVAQGVQADDHWYVDDVQISQFCRVDLNQDGRLNIFDFVGYQSALGAMNTTADWNGDGAINVLDFAAFLNTYAAGCTGY